MEVMTTRQIVEQLLSNATANKDTWDYQRALRDVLMFDEQHKQEQARYLEQVRENTAAAIGGAVASERFEQMITAAVPELTPDEQFELALRVARLEGFARRLIDLDDPELLNERRWVNLDQILEWARQALGEK